MPNSDAKALRRLPTGVPGLDAVLAGGLIETSVCIVQGPAGAGKTILANQICFHQVEQGNRAVYFTLLTEVHDRMIGFLQGMSFFDQAAIPDQLTYVSGFKSLEADGLSGVVRNIRELVTAQRPSLLVIDGLATAEEMATSDTAFKKFVHEMQTIAALFRTTILLLTSTARRLEAVSTLVDAVIALAAPVVRLKPQRTLEVRKLRGAAQVRGVHTYQIDDDGITVLPRFETVMPPPAAAARGSSGERDRSGVAGLDDMLQGGFPRSSNTMLLGPSGIGKTVLGLHFVAEALAVGEKALFLTFYERREELEAKAARLGLSAVTAGIESGALEIMWRSSVEANLDDIGATLLAAFERVRPSRVFVDGLHGFQVTADPPERIQDFFAALADHLASRGATLLFTAESPDLVGETGIRPPFPNASRMCQNILVLRYAELAGVMRRVISIIKLRDSDFDPRLREITIGARGIEVGEPITRADMLLSGQPRRREDSEG